MYVCDVRGVWFDCISIQNYFSELWTTWVKSGKFIGWLRWNLYSDCVLSWSNTSNKIAATCNKIWFQRMLVEMSTHVASWFVMYVYKHFQLTWVEIRFFWKLQQFCCSSYSSFNTNFNNTSSPFVSACI
jgi:hypothetical protein